MDKLGGFSCAAYTHAYSGAQASAHGCSDASTSPVTTLVTLLVKEEGQQSKEPAGKKAPAAVVDDNQCKR